MLLSSSAFAQDYYVYELFNNKFQAAFPGRPSISDLPKDLLDADRLEKLLPYEQKKHLTQKQIKKIALDTIKQLRNSQPYVYFDKVNKITFTALSIPSNLEQKNYKWSSIKQLLDDLIKKGLKTANQTLIKLSSTLDKNKSTYIAIYSYSYFVEGQKFYSSTKNIYYKDKSYKWTVTSVNKNNKNIFDKYSKYCKVIE